MVWCTGFLRFICSFAVFASLSSNPSVHPSCKSSSVWVGLVVSERLLQWTYNLKVAKIWLFFFHTSLKSSIDYTAYSCYHIYALLQASFFPLILSSPAFQRPEDNGTPHDAIVLPLSLVGGDLKFCFKTATVPILLNPPILLLPLSPSSSWVYYLTLLNFSQSYWRPGVHWGVSYTAESETEIDRDLAACYSTTLSGNKKSFCSFLCYSREIKLGITHTHRYFCAHSHWCIKYIYVCVSIEIQIYVRAQKHTHTQI